MVDQLVDGIEKRNGRKGACAAHARQSHARGVFCMPLAEARVLPQAPPGPRLEAMEARAAKRLAQIEHVKAKPYYLDVSDILIVHDPRNIETSATEWKTLVSAWKRAMKAIHRQRHSTPGAPEPEAMGGA